MGFMLLASEMVLIETFILLSSLLRDDPFIPCLS
jgi:hypothetical protein